MYNVYLHTHIYIYNYTYVHKYIFIIYIYIYIHMYVIPKSPNMMFFDQASSEVPVPAEAALATRR